MPCEAQENSGDCTAIRPYLTTSAVLGAALVNSLQPPRQHHRLRCSVIISPPRQASTSDSAVSTAST
jgi:hypothetical protein